VQIQSLTPEIADSLGLKESRGALVAEAQENGPAAKAGIQTGDVITAVNGKEISDSRELARLIAGMSPSVSATLKVSHSGRDKTIALTLGKLLVILDVDPDGIAAEQGLAACKRDLGGS